MIEPLHLTTTTQWCLRQPGRRRSAGSPFRLFAGLALVAGYAVLGATWLIMKTTGELQSRSRAVAPPLAVSVVVAIVVVSAWMAIGDPAVGARWLTWPRVGFSFMYVGAATLLPVILAYARVPSHLCDYGMLKV